jgi:hypothetical protein
MTQFYANEKNLKININMKKLNRRTYSKRDKKNRVLIKNNDITTQKNQNQVIIKTFDTLLETSKYLNVSYKTVLIHIKSTEKKAINKMYYIELIENASDSNIGATKIK